MRPALSPHRNHPGNPSPFLDKLNQYGIHLFRQKVEILQINLGKFCNQTCRHCHVAAGPYREEKMQKKTAKRIMNLLENHPTIHTVDLTGGAPELNSNFSYLVATSRKLGKQVIDRCNLTVLFEKGQEGLGIFLAENQVKLVASLPCYSKVNVDRQRGRGVFEKSVRALRLLNELGYGMESSGLTLDLVYNPLGAYLPPQTDTLETNYKRELKEKFGIRFNRLVTMTNMPIKRFQEELYRQNKFNDYMALLSEAFNPETTGKLMCRNLISIGWDGRIFDCDFNQMLEIPAGNKKQTVFDTHTLDFLDRQSIAVGDHCFGCTAGKGSSCGGVLLQKGDEG